MHELQLLRPIVEDNPLASNASTNRLVPRDRQFNKNSKLVMENDRPDGEVRASQPPMFTPIWLKVAALAGFLAIFLTLMILLGILYHLAQTENGFPIAQGDQYSWKYGPTVVLLGGLWRQVDYWCKTLGPWQALYENWTDANHSVMIDYVGQIQVFACWSALRRKHWAVFGSITGVLLLRLMTALSTGILTVHEAHVTNGSVIVVPSVDPLSGVFGKSDSPYTRQGPLEVYYGVLNQGLQFPDGLTDSFAIQTFKAKDPLPPKTTKLATNVTGFWPSLQCTEGSVSWNLTKNTTDMIQLDFETADGRCSAGKQTPVNITLLDRQRSILPHRLVSPRMLPLAPDCQGQNKSKDHLFFAVADVRYHQDLVPNAQQILETHTNPPVIAQSSEIQVESITGILCSRDYDFKTAQVEIDPSDPRSRRGPGLRATPIAPSLRYPTFYGNEDDGAKIWDPLFFPILETEKNRFGADQSLDPATAAWFRLMLSERDRGDYSSLLNPSHLIERAKATFSPVMVLIYDFAIGDPAFVSLPSELVGTAVHQEDRLFVQMEPLVVMETCLFLMTCLIIVTMVFGPRKVVPRSPDSIGIIATILAGSHRLTQLLDRSGYWDDATLKERLTGQRFRTRVGHGEGQGHTFSLDVDGDPPVRDNEAPDGPIKTTKDYWKPLGETVSFRVLILVAAPILVILLAVLKVLSNRPGGILELPNNTTSDLFIRYVPAVLMLATSIMYGTFGAGVLSLAPYRVLSRGSGSQQQSIFANYNRDMPLVTLWKGIMHRQPPVVFGVLAMLTASFLTILVPALFWIDTSSTVSQTATVHRSDLFNLTWGEDGWWDNGASMVQELTEYSNMTFPSFTHNTMAFPSLLLPDLGTEFLNQTNQETSRMTVRVPTVRPRLKCTILDSVTLNPRRLNNGSSTTVIQAAIDLPSLYPGCLRDGVYGNSTEFRFNRTIQFENTKPAYVGFFTDLHVGPVPHNQTTDALYHQYLQWGVADSFTTEYLDQDFGIYQPYTNFYGGQNPDGCPSVGIIFGHLVPGGTDPSNITAGVCDQVIEEVMTEATFFLPSLDLDLSRPPTPDEPTAHVLSNGRDFDTRQYRPEYHTSRGLAVFVITWRSFMDPFYQTAILGVDGVPAAEMTGRGSVQRLLDRTNQIYATYMALAISSKMRHEIGNTSQVDLGDPESRSIQDQDDSLTFQADVVQPRSVLRQDRRSTIILQSLLGFIFFCSAIASFLTWKPAPLMHDSGSIAGVASLVAGSEIASRRVVPEGTEWLSMKEMEAERLFEGMRFEMSWREAGDDGNERVYRIHAM
ncbi:hypothetical protein FE257_012839 [Aspergillus nanangensis]|uniref:Uncharacterized protein n=1 Tax=Aspergillus nanangensis TaxID=2582783 RepID=A0AAD4CH05_ASPNN|nr:hypothetical protein FE257_012839 [Aspergillus nanangensis]